MFNQDAQTIQRMSPHLQRALVVDAQPASARLIADMMRQVCRPELMTSSNAGEALELAQAFGPQVIFAELSEDGIDGVAFTRALRRSDLACRKAPVVLMTGAATAGAILAARDAGVHEFLRKPFTTKDLLRRLEAVTLRPREWVEAVDYVGPDRRRFNSGDYKGPLKRQADQPGASEIVRIAQALKILRSAVPAIDRDPRQALRAMLAQTTDLQVTAATVGDSRLGMAVGELHRYLFETSSAGARPDRVEIERRAAPVLSCAPHEAVRAA